MYLTFGGDIKLDTFEIQSDCYTWYQSNVVAHEKRKKLLEVIITTTCMIKNELLAIYAMVKVVFRIILNCAYRSTLKLNCYSRSIDFFLT